MVRSSLGLLAGVKSPGALPTPALLRHMLVRLAASGGTGQTGVRSTGIPAAWVEMTGGERARPR